MGAREGLSYYKQQCVSVPTAAPASIFGGMFVQCILVAMRELPEIHGGLMFEVYLQVYCKVLVN